MLSIATRDRDEFQDWVRAAVSERVEVLRPGFRVDACMRFLPRVSLFSICMQNARAFSEARDGVNVTLPVTGAFEVREGRRTLDFSDGCAYVADPWRPVDIRPHEDNRNLVVVFDPSLVEAHAAAQDLLRADAELRFSSRIVDGPRESAFFRLAHLVWRELQQDGSALRLPLVAAEVQDALAAALVGAYLATDFAPAGPAASQSLRRAEEFLAAHLRDPISLPEVAAMSGLSVRSLTRAFQKRHGMGPIRFLRLRRLEAARRDLLAAEPGSSSVTEVMHRYGFGHPGRFAAQYRRQFGESPSVTLVSRAHHSGRV